MYIPVYGSIIIFKFCRQFQYLALKWDSIIFFNVYLWDDFHRLCVGAYWDCKSACNGWNGTTWQERTKLLLNVVWCGFDYELVQAILILLHLFTFQSQQWELKSIKSASKYFLSQFMLIDLISVIINVSKTINSYSFCFPFIFLLVTFFVKKNNYISISQLAE